jgi:RNA polymerase sigma factor (sigma-70 family)
MAIRPMNGVVQRMRRVVREGAGLTDAQLLDDYISRQDESAFAALVRRHGPMVWGVCRRILPSHHDAEDAFQATFIVLVRKAAAIASRELLANWLHGVAHQTALKARATAARRKGRERQGTEMPEPAVTQPDSWRDVRQVLDEELSRLPDRYRSVIVLCELEGKSRKEASLQIGCPEGTVAGRLVRARAMLAKRLTRRGITLSVGALAAMLSQRALSAGLPTSVVESTIHAAGLLAAGRAAATGALSAKVAALTEEVIKAMLFTKLKAALTIVLALGFMAAGASLTCHTVAGQDGKKPTEDKPVRPDPVAQRQTDQAKPGQAEPLVKVEVAVATAHLPEDLKAGARVDLQYVKAVMHYGTGKVVYDAPTVVAGIEVVSVTRLEKPMDPDRAVKVELRVTKEQAARIDKEKQRLVDWSEPGPGRTKKTVKKLVPLRFVPHQSKQPQSGAATSKGGGIAMGDLDKDGRPDLFLRDYDPDGRLDRFGPAAPAERVVTLDDGTKHPLDPEGLLVTKTLKGRFIVAWNSPLTVAEADGPIPVKLRDIPLTLDLRDFGGSKQAVVRLRALAGEAAVKLRLRRAAGKTTVQLEITPVTTTQEAEAKAGGKPLRLKLRHDAPEIEVVPVEGSISVRVAASADR